MGMIRQLTCPSCHKTWQICTGHGMRHGTLGRVMEVFSEDIQREIAAGAAGGWLPLFHFDYRTAICGQCRDVVAVPVLRLIEKDQTYVGTCPVCGICMADCIHPDLREEFRSAFDSLEPGKSVRILTAMKGREESFQQVDLTISDNRHTVNGVPVWELTIYNLFTIEEKYLQASDDANKYRAFLSMYQIGRAHV